MKRKALLWFVAPVLVCAGVAFANHPIYLPGPGYVDDTGVARGSITSSGTIQAEQLTSTDDATVTDDLSVGGDINLTGAGDLTGLDDIYSDPPATDAAPRVTSVQSQPVFAGVNATNTTGAHLLLSGTPGAINLTGVTKANTTGDTIAFAYTLADGTSATVTLTEGVDYDCDGAASDIECVCNLYTAVTGHATLGTVVNTLRTDATCSDERLFFGIVPGVSTWLVVTPSDNTNTVRVAGTSGSVVVPDGTAAAPGLRMTSEASGLYLYGAGALAFSVAGTHRAYLSATALNIAGSNGLIVKDAGTIAFSTRATMASPADGVMILNNAAGTQGIKFDTATTDGTLTLTDELGAAVSLTIGGTVTAAAGTISTVQSAPGSGFSARSRLVTSAANGENATFGSGNNTNVGDYSTGKAILMSGATTTDGDTGDVEIYTGVAGAGTADAGDVKMSVNGAPGTGTDVFQALGATGAVDMLKIQQADAAATCTVGQIVIDTGGATKELCYCQAANTWYCAAMAAGPAD